MASSAPEPLTADELAEKLEPLSSWRHDDVSIQRTFEFDSFVQAFGFMAEAALHAEKLNHHPEWSNVYNRVDVRLTTHDADGLTELDIDLATKMSEIAARRSS